MQARQPLLIIAEDVEGEALQGLVLNRVNGNLPVIAVKSPGYGQHKHDLMSDISILTGAKIASPSTGLSIESLTLNDLGTLKKVVVDAKSTTIVSSGATKFCVEERISELRTQLQDVTLNPDEIFKLKIRIAKLAAGVAVIKVGGATEVEMIERKYRIEDALNATRAAAEEGVVPGGGMALISISQQLESFISKLSTDEAAGASILLKSCFAPLRKIVENCEGSADVIIKELLSTQLSNGWGYNAACDSFINLIEAGVIDPVKVTRTALKNASSVAATFLNLDAVVFDEEE
jgi:chaperonin GroEL